MSGERLQDHWSSGFFSFNVGKKNPGNNMSHEVLGSNPVEYGP